jgi:hypothetical protein
LTLLQICCTGCSSPRPSPRGGLASNSVGRTTDQNRGCVLLNNTRKDWRWRYRSASASVKILAALLELCVQRPCSDQSLLTMDGVTELWLRAPEKVKYTAWLEPKPTNTSCWQSAQNCSYTFAHPAEGHTMGSEHPPEDVCNRRCPPPLAGQHTPCASWTRFGRLPQVPLCFRER